MAQLVVRQLPDQVKERLKRRAKRHGRSLEAEVRDILCQVREASHPTTAGSETTVQQLARRMREIGVTDADVDALEASIEELDLETRIASIDR